MAEVMAKRALLQPLSVAGGGGCTSAASFSVVRGKAQLAWREKNFGY